MLVGILALLVVLVLLTVAAVIHLGGTSTGRHARRSTADVTADLDPVTGHDTRRDQIIEAVAVHTPELINEGPNGEDGGQHLYCIECGVLPIDGLGLQYGPEHVADAVIPITGQDRGLIYRGKGVR